MHKISPIFKWLSPTCTEQVSFGSIADIWLLYTCVFIIAHFFLRFILSSLFVMSVLLSYYPVSKEQISRHFSLPDNLSFKIVASKRIFLSFRLKLERYNVFTLDLGWAVFLISGNFSCIFFLMFPSLYASSHLSVFQICLFSLLPFVIWWFFFYLQHYWFLCSIV